MKKQQNPQNNNKLKVGMIVITKTREENRRVPMNNVNRMYQGKLQLNWLLRKHKKKGYDFIFFFMYYNNTKN